VIDVPLGSWEQEEARRYQLSLDTRRRDGPGAGTPLRRHVGPWLWGSLLITIATAVTAGFFNLNDERHLSADRWADIP